MSTEIPPHDHMNEDGTETEPTENASTWETEETGRWLANDENLYNEARALAASCLTLSDCAAVFRENFAGMMPSLGVADVDDINWEEVAEDFFTE